MTNEEKQQLTIALCGYLPYGLKGKYELPIFGNFNLVDYNLYIQVLQAKIQTT